VKTIETHQENIKHKLRVDSARDLRERAGKWVEQSLGAEEHLFRGGRDRKRRVRSTALSVVAAFDAQQTAGSQVKPETAATASPLWYATTDKGMGPMSSAVATEPDYPPDPA
jgi:hypothetical protein